MAALRIADADIIFFALWFLLSVFYLVSSPILSRRRLDVNHISTHIDPLVGI